MEDKIKDYIVKLYEKYNTVQIGKMMNISAMTVFRVLRERGIDTRSKRRSDTEEKRQRDEDIRYEYLQGYTDRKKLAEKYNLSVSRINLILSPTKWEECPAKRVEQIKQAIIDSVVFHESITSIARRFEVSRQYVHKVKRQMKKEGVF